LCLPFFLFPFRLILFLLSDQIRRSIVVLELCRIRYSSLMTFFPQCEKLWTGFIWLKIGTGGGILWTRLSTLRFHKSRRIPWLAEWLLASQEGLCHMELVSTEKTAPWGTSICFHFVIGWLLWSGAGSVNLRSFVTLIDICNELIGDDHKY
jgi:hypothetical protein